MGSTSVLTQTYGWYKKMIKTVLLWSLECVSSLTCLQSSQWVLHLLDWLLSSKIPFAPCPFLLCESPSFCFLTKLSLFLHPSLRAASYFWPAMTKYCAAVVTRLKRKRLKLLLTSHVESIQINLLLASNRKSKQHATYTSAWSYFVK